MLTAMERIVVDIEIAFFQRHWWKKFGARFEGRADRAKLHGDKFGLRDDIAVPVE